MADKLYAVFTPVKNFKGRRFGVVFIDGKGMATKREATVLVKNWGYKCPELDAETNPPVPPAPPASTGSGTASKEDAKPPIATAPNVKIKNLEDGKQNK